MLPKVMLLNKLVESGVIAVIRRIPEDQIELVAESLVEGGVTALEVTVDSPGAFTVISKLSKKMRGRALVGAGTVLDGESARLAIQSGAEFIFSPSLHQEVVRTALRYGKIAVPGVMTPTEMITAIEWGADLVKIFPAAGLGVQYIKDIKAPFPHIPVIPTGGINLENVASFVQAGVAAVGIGGNLVDYQAIEESDFERITQTAKQYVTSIQEARQIMKKSEPTIQVTIK
ncbi:bifunctional 4-hydroxy-2-oxoglutarate aldolase/2-dehydro-3-deoxy-phosphogluconate aldolase [Cytobacillus depressus]|uniref:Bifunctional 4-hydroxy-2-oxoglutarate aldolase/2-dehydro-3-deoxy-phosphogluconate aldolase n=1 Tax=Cytobacillus depressus TaxID=1602942 RepID=A0A6L3V1C0_9BACI|nr:bifunctional 4-hydroxy-2-oxoglutarate aldolase/2-dehydro-3-deoxy-phosphogluconate aldolase [Cytobacillus depressus]KAB2329557.1 bifunctional 4-hydroxy-2-oxoglutarate aldolase/2-dehydro-3-deoxy-phosphogluconate aldolase [Cytobacillus depressus]